MIRLLALLVVSADPQSVPRNLEDCIVLALSENANLLAQAENLEGVRAQGDITWRRLLPTISAKSSGTLRDVSENARNVLQGSVQLLQPIYRGRALWLGAQTGELAIQEARLELLRQRQELVKDVTKLWYTLLESRMLTSAAAAAVERLKQHAHNASHFFAEGKIWRNDVLQAQVEVARGQQTLIQAQNRTELTSARLNQLLQRALDGKLAGGASIERTTTSWAYDAALAHAQEHRPDLLRLRLTQTRQRYAELAASAGFQPRLDLQASLQATRSGDSTSNDARVLLSLDWDVWQWGTTKKDLELARAQTRKAQHLLDAAELQVELDVKQAWLALTEAEKSVEVLVQALAQAEENFRVSEIRYREQLGSANDVLLAQGLITQTESEHISALARYRVALAELDLAIGVAR